MRISIVFCAFVATLMVGSQTSAQTDGQILEGSGIEIGGGQNNLFWITPPHAPVPIAPGFLSVDRTALRLSPNIRITYYMNLTNNLIIMPFLGYNQFGGKKRYLDSEIKDEWDQYKINAIEIGSFYLYNYFDISIGVGFKFNCHLNLLYSSYFDEFNEDRFEFLEKWSEDLGLRASYKLSPICISVESWFGLSNLVEGFKVRENHYRVLVGYNF